MRTFLYAAPSHSPNPLRPSLSCPQLKSATTSVVNLSILCSATACMLFVAALKPMHFVFTYFYYLLNDAPCDCCHMINLGMIATEGLLNLQCKCVDLFRILF